MLDQHSAALGYLATRSQHFLNHYREGRSTFEAAVAAARVGAPIGEDDEREAIAVQQELAHRYEAQADGLIAAASGAPGGDHQGGRRPGSMRSSTASWPSTESSSPTSKASDATTRRRL